MEFLANDLSLHGQFADLTSFKAAVDRLMMIRQIALRFGRSVYCHRNIAFAQVTPVLKMPQAVQSLTVDKRRAFLLWLTQQGPFWEDARQHGPDDWLEWNGTIVTDTGVGEAGWYRLNGIERSLVSLSPSRWEFSPVSVEWVLDDDRRSVDVPNFWDPAAVESSLQGLRPSIASWAQLEATARSYCGELTFAKDAFVPLKGHPFFASAAQRLLFICRAPERE